MTSKPSIGRFRNPTQETISASIETRVLINRHHLQLILEKILNFERRASLDDAFPWIALMFGTLLALIPADFNEYLSLSAAVWEALAILIVIWSAIRIGNVFWRMFKQRGDEQPSSEDMIEQLIVELQSSGNE